MNLSRKIILLIVSTFIALIFIVAATADLILIDSFAKVEEKVLRGDVAKVVNEIHESFAELDSVAKDYGEQIRWGAKNLIPTLPVDSFVTHRIDLVCRLKRSGEVLEVEAADFHGRHFVDISTEKMNQIKGAVLSVTGREGRPWSGFVATGGDNLQFAFRPLSDGTLMFVARCIDREEISRISSLTGFVIEARPVEEQGLPADFMKARAKLLGGADFHSVVIGADQIAGYTMFNDIYDKPLLLLKVATPRPLYSQGRASIMYIMLALLISGMIFCGVTLVFVRGAVLKRLATLSGTVREISRRRDVSSRLETRRGVEPDELDDLTVSINTMLESLESAESSLRESEERYRVLFERAPDSIIIIGTEGDEAGRIIAANGACAEMHGYTVDELKTMRIYDLNTSETNLVVPQVMERILNGEWVNFEVWHTKKDGASFPIEVHAGIIKLGGRTYILGFDRDITARKLAEESDRMYLEQIRLLNDELSRKAVDLELANKELETFNYSVSHDLRSPLTRISGYCQLMLDDPSTLDPQSRTYLRRVYEACCWLDQMIDALLRLSQYVRAEFTPQQVDLSELCEGKLEILRLAETDRNVEALVEPGVTAFGDADLLRVMMYNLVNNAWKYTVSADPARIEFGVLKDAPVPVYFVRDNGVGFDMKDADKIFRPFARLHDPNLFSGSGIGLATVQRIVRRHGGKIWAEGEPGKGAVFFFTLETGTLPATEDS